MVSLFHLSPSNPFMAPSGWERDAARATDGVVGEMSIQKEASSIPRQGLPV